MEMNPNKLIIMAFTRTYCSLDAEEAEAVADLVLALHAEDSDNDYVDLFDLIDDVWAASLLAGTISERETNPPHPLSYRERQLNWATDPHELEHLMAIPLEEWPEDPPKPKRYKDSKFVSIKNKRKRKRRKWDKGGD